MLGAGIHEDGDEILWFSDLYLYFHCTCNIQMYFYYCRNSHCIMLRVPQPLNGTALINIAYILNRFSTKATRSSRLALLCTLFINRVYNPFVTSLLHQRCFPLFFILARVVSVVGHVNRLDDVEHGVY